VFVHIIVCEIEAAYEIVSDSKLSVPHLSCFSDSHGCVTR
jgi:hypothetical protein